MDVSSFEECESVWGLSCFAWHSALSYPRISPGAASFGRFADRLAAVYRGAAFFLGGVLCFGCLETVDGIFLCFRRAAGPCFFEHRQLRIHGAHAFIVFRVIVDGPGWSGLDLIGTSPAIATGVKAATVATVETLLYCCTRNKG